MIKSTIIETSPEEIAKVITAILKKELQELVLNPKVQELKSFNRPHLTRKETAMFFGISLNCINDWSKKGILKPIKVGQRTYFRKNDLLEIFLNKE